MSSRGSDRERLRVEPSANPGIGLEPNLGDLDDLLAIHRWEDDGGISSRLTDSDKPVSLLFTKKSADSSLNRKEAVLAKAVYPTLANHQVAETDWEHADLSALLHQWYERFNIRFRLNLPQAPLRLDPTIRQNCAGYFRPGYNEFGLVYEIAIRIPPPEQLRDLDIGDILGTLLHEQLHLLQELTGIAGRNNYHNVQFRSTAERFGLIVDHRGHQTYDLDSPYLDLLAEFGVAPPRSVEIARSEASGAQPPLLSFKQAGRSKLAKWSCGCTNVRVGVAEFHASCTRPDCGKPYLRC